MQSFALVLILMLVACVGQIPDGAAPTRHANGGVKWQTGKPIVDVRDYGAIGDGQVATDCSIRSSQAVVTCSTSHFVAGDVGRSVGMWGAGPTVFKSPSKYITTLTTTIASYQSATQITLADNATNTANPSTHLVWGTNNYTALNTAISAANALYPNGYVLFFPAGYYLTPTVDFPCGAIGTFGSYTCTTATKNVTIAGASATSTTIENFKADRGSKGGTSGECGNYTYACGLIMFGNQSTNDHAIQNSAHWVNGVTIHDLTLIEVQNSKGTFFSEPQNIDLDGTSNAEVYNVNVQWSAYMCIAGGNEPSDIHDNYAYHCGWGGPAYSGTNSAINVVVPNGKTVRNRVYYSGQGIEGGAPNQEISYNFMEADDGKGKYPPSSVTPELCLNIGSATYGMWNTHVTGNTCLNWALGPGNGNSGNVLNTNIMSNMVVENNSFINSGAFSLGSGGEGPNTGWPSGEIATNIHGTSIFRHNTFRYNKDVTVGTQGLGIILNAQAEKWVVDGNDILLPGNASNCGSCVGLILQRSFPAWQPATAYTNSNKNPSYIQPSMPNGFYYATITGTGTCMSGTSGPTFPTTVGNTVRDGTCTWTNMAAKPVQVISNLHIGFPPGSTNGAYAIQNQGMLDSDVELSNLTNSGDIRSSIAGIGMNVNGWNVAGFPQAYWGLSDDATPSNTQLVLIREQSPYGNSLRTAMSNNTLPVGAYYRVGDYVQQLAQNGGTGQWMLTVSGWRAKTWVASTAYPYNALVQSSPDDHHLFAVTDAAGCTSGTAQPSWNTGSGAITKDNTCHWRESGASAQFSLLPPI